nr:hypothetical protein [Tanacetum cinerariifolium]
MDKNIINQGVQVMPSSEQSNVVNQLETKITNDNNIILYSQYVTESQQAAVQNSKTTAQQDGLILSVIEQLKTQVINCTNINLDNKSVNDTLTAELERYKEQGKVLKEGQNVEKAQQLEPKLYDGNVIKNTCAIMILDYEETLTLAEESRSKMILKQQDPMVLEKRKCLKLETKLLNRKDFIEKEIYDKLFRSYTTLEKHCISLEVDTQLNQKKFQRDNSVSNQSASSFDQYFELNELKAQSQKKDTVISKLKERIKSLSGNVNNDKEQGLIIAALRDKLRKLKGKAIVDNTITTHTIDPEMLKVDVEPIASRLLNNRTVHSNYLRLTQEQAVILKEVVEQGKS